MTGILFNAPLAFSVILGGFFIFDGEAEPLWRVIVGLYIVGSIVLMLNEEIHPLVPMVMQCVLVIVLVLYYRFQGLWPR